MSAMKRVATHVNECNVGLKETCSVLMISEHIETLFFLGLQSTLAVSCEG